jgi:mRNA-degrading endonuclease HigB of HigAB toxin-antitoxin module
MMVNKENTCEIKKEQKLVQVSEGEWKIPDDIKSYFEPEEVFIEANDEEAAQRYFSIIGCKLNKKLNSD